MTYSPKPPVRDKSKRSPELDDIFFYVETELESISRELLETLQVELRTTSVEPKKPRNGMIVEADGIGWNPGAGAGLYVYRLGVWVNIGGGGGTPGSQGQLGPPGYDGIDGLDGSQGPQGNQGPPGNTGTSGTAGTSGDRGPPGYEGDEGLQGPPGVDGAVGPIGPTGPAGAVGPQGPVGPEGLEGPQGDLGPQGVAGASWGGRLGTTVVDFGAFPGKSDASVTVTGLTGILTTSIVNAWLFAQATTDHTADEHLAETVQITAGNIVANTGFTVYATNTSQLNEPIIDGRGGIGTRIYGKFTVNYEWVL